MDPTADHNVMACLYFNPGHSTSCKIVVVLLQRVYNYIHDKVSRVHNVAGILLLQYIVYVMLFPLINVLYFHISASRSV